MSAEATTRLAAFRAGRAACESGQALHTNPHADGSEAHGDWQCGWQAGLYRRAHAKQAAQAEAA